MTATQNKSTATVQQLATIRRISDAILEAISAAGDSGVPSGHLYAMLMGKMSLDTYNQFVGALVSAGKITNKGHLLKVV